MCIEGIDERYKFNAKKEKGFYVIDCEPMFLGMVGDLKKGKGKGIIATKFHNSMAGVVVETVKRLSKELKIKRVALSGGVFQNRFLKNKVIKGLNKLDITLFINEKNPVNDLNISLGQYYVSCNTCKN